MQITVASTHLSLSQRQSPLLSGSNSYQDSVSPSSEVWGHLLSDSETKGGWRILEDRNGGVITGVGNLQKRGQQIHQAILSGMVIASLKGLGGSKERNKWHSCIFSSIYFYKHLQAALYYMVGKSYNYIKTIKDTVLISQS